MADEKEPKAVEPAEPEADGEGHSFSIVMGMDGLNRSARRHPDATAKRQDETLPRLTKPFPRMRDQKRG